MAITLVQHAQASTTTLSTLATTFTSNITAGNAIVVCNIINTDTPTPSSGTDSFSLVVSDVTNGQAPIWVAFNSVGGYKTVNVGAVAAFEAVWIYEVSGISAVDKTSTANNAGSASTFTSGGTATTTAAAEFWVGIGIGWAGSGSRTATGPSSPWTNETSINNLSKSGFVYSQVSGFQITTSAGTATYSGTFSAAAGDAQDGSVATFKAASGAAAKPVFNRQQAVQRASYY